jgi:hypothetical protein
VTFMLRAELESWCRGAKCERLKNGLRYETKESVEPLEICQFQVLVERMKRGRMNREAVGGPSNPK